MRLYELYSSCSIEETVRDRKDRYDKADDENRKKIEKDVNIEVEGFSIWLEETKNLNPLSAHSVAVSLKSLLLGLPIGLSMAKLFDIILSDARFMTE